MEQIFKIASATKVDDFMMIGEFSIVSEEFFWETVNVKVRQITEGKPERFESLLADVTEHLNEPLGGLSIIDTHFKIEVIKDKK